jgi:hypothetical protein
MARPQSGYGLGRIVDGRDVHAPLPVRPVEVLDDHRDRTAHRLAVPHPGHDLDAVAFDLLATTSSVAFLAPPQVDVDVFGQHGQARRQVLHEDRQLRTVRLTRGEYAEHAQAHTPILSATAP